MSCAILQRAVLVGLLVVLLCPGLLMAQGTGLNPTTVGPDEQYQFKRFLDEVLKELIGKAGDVFQSTAMAIWKGLATVMIVWAGLKVAFSGEFDMWEILKLVLFLGAVHAMLTYYETPIPGSGGRSFPQLITEQGTWATDMFIGNSWKNLVETLTTTYNKALGALTEAIRKFGYTDVFTKGISFLIASLIGGSFLIMVLLMLLLMFCLLYAQIIWAQIALAICVLVGPLLIPWLVFPPMSFLFWGWLRAMLTYTFYGVVAGAIFNVFLNVGLGFLNRLVTTALTFQDLPTMFTWFLILIPLVISGWLAAIKVGELSQLLLSGAGSATAGLGQRVRQVAAAKATGGASLAAGAVK